jgi:hypothetical protein
MDEIDKTFNRLKIPVYDEINEKLSKQGIITVDMIDIWLKENGYSWTYEDFLRERRARLFRDLK